MSTLRERTPSLRCMSDGDVKQGNMGHNEKKRKADAQPSQDLSPARSQRTIKKNNTPTKLSPSAPKKFPPSLFTPQRTITVAIASSEDPSSFQRFSLHEKLLCYHSSFFAQALKDANSPLEASPEPITLHDIDHSTFGLFCNWIYYQKICSEQGQVPGLVDMAKLWVLGERFGCAALQNAAMDDIREEVTYPADFEPFLLFAYQLEGHGDVLRRLAILRLALTLPGPFKNILGMLPLEAQMDLIMELKNQRDAVPKEFWQDIGPAKDFYVMGKSDEEQND